MSVPRPARGLARLRNFAVDVVLVGGAVSYATDLASAWLVAHEVELAHLVGALHIVMLPLLLLALVVGRSSRQGGAARRHALLWSLMGYYALGFIVPLAIDEHAGIGEAFRSATVGGQLGVGIATLFALLKLEPYRFLRTPRVVTWVVSFVAGAYLLGLEAALMAISHGGQVYAGRLGIVAIAVAGYLPVRLYLAVALEGHKWDLVAMAIAFAHFVWRIVT